MYYQQDSRRIYARATDLVIGFLVSLGNYTYGINWVFKQDGSFAFEVELVGEGPDQARGCGGMRGLQASVRGAGPNGEKRTFEAAGGRSLRHARSFQCRGRQPPALVQRAARLRHRRHGQRGHGAQRPAREAGRAIFHHHLHRFRKVDRRQTARRGPWVEHLDGLQSELSEPARAYRPAMRSCRWTIRRR